jgi:ABC-type nitrate/sulfonate/bicarbonate transport system substrate-binding protein
VITTKRTIFGIAAITVAIVVAIIACRSSVTGNRTLRVAIAPYQDLAILTTHRQLNLDQTYGTSIELVTLQWEDIVPALGSAGRTIDVGFGSVIEFLTKYDNLNGDGSDPLVYVFPCYAFKGLGYVTFNPTVPDLTDQASPSSETIKAFLKYRIGAQKNSMFDMMIYVLGKKVGLKRTDIHVVDTTMDDGFLAAQAGSIDIVAAGVTQRHEALERGGRLVLAMEKLGFADLTGLICKRSVLETRRKDIENLLRIWFDCVNFVYSDLDRNSEIPLSYLAKNSATKFTVASYKKALEAAFLPRSLSEAEKELVDPSGRYSIRRISSDVSSYLVELNIVSRPPPVPQPISVTR